MNIPSVQNFSWHDASIGDAFTHGLTQTCTETVGGQNHNIGTAEVGFEAVVAPRSARKKLSRRSDVRGLSNAEMLLAYDKLEREMYELLNSIARRINPNDPEALNAWRERVESARAESYGDNEERASQLAQAAGKVREKQYAGTRVIRIAPMKETGANANERDAHEERTNGIAHRGSHAIKANTTPSRVETNIVKKEKAKRATAT